MRCDLCPVPLDRYCPGEGAGNVVCHRPEYRESFARLASVSSVQEPEPRLIRAVSRLRRSGDRGVGDTVHRLLGPLGGRVIERWHERVLGRSCGCQDRRERLNAIFPYGRS